VLDVELLAPLREREAAALDDPRPSFTLHGVITGLMGDADDQDEARDHALGAAPQLLCVPLGRVRLVGQVHEPCRIARR